MRDGVDSGADVALVVNALGRLDIRRNGQSVQHLIPQKAALLVVYLADNGGRVHRSTLAGLLYSDVQEDRARANLRVVLTRLRSVLPEVISADREHIWLSSPVHYDAHELISSQDGETALLHYRGDFLEDARPQGAPLFDDWLAARRQNLRTAAVRALSSSASVTHAAGNWERCWQYASRVVELEPWNEAAHRQLMSALAATSGPSAAVAQFGECESILANELGLEPSQETVALRDQLLQAQQITTPPPRPGKTGIPSELTPFFGRSSELALIQDRLSSGGSRLLTVSGPGGAGKTRLAAEVARRCADSYQDGLHFVALAQARSLSNVLVSIVEALAPAARIGLSDLVGQLTDLIGNGRICLVLDNVEQVVDEVAVPLVDLLGRCPKLQLLTTSREPLGVRGEDVFELRGLEVPAPDDLDVGSSPAVRLFVDRAYRVNKAFSLANEDPAQVGALCRLVEGMPLHIELVAAHITTESVTSLLAMLLDAQPLAGHALRDAPDRHRSFDAVFEHSWETLDPAEKTALTTLSVTHGGFDTKAAAALIGSDAIEVARLTRKSLLVDEGNGRYRFHELLRQSAHSRLEPDERIQAERNHARWYLAILADCERALISSRAKDATSMLLPDLENMRRAWARGVEYGMTDDIGRAAVGLGYLFELAGRRLEAADVLLAAADAISNGDLSHNGAYDEAFFVRVASGQLASLTTDGRIDVLCDRVEALLLDRDDRIVDRAWSQLHRAQSAFYRGDLERTALLLDACRDNVGVNASVEAWTMLQRGRLRSATGAFDEAVSTYLEAIRRFEDLDDVRAQALAHSYLAPTFAEQNLVWEAFEADRAAMKLSELIGNEQRRGDMHLNLGASYVLFGAFEAAREQSAEALAVFRQTGDLQVEGYALAQHGECLLGLGKVDAGEADLVEGLRLSRDQGFSYGLLYNLPPWARHLESCGRKEQALLVADELIQIAADRTAEHFLLTGHALRARVLAALNRHEESLALAQQTLERLRSPNPPRLPWPVSTLLDLAAAFRAVNHPAEAAVLAEAREIRHETARSIADPELRRTYLEDLPASIELLSLD